MEFMENYDELAKNIRDNGTAQFNKRTGEKCLVLVGEQVKWDLSFGFPATTNKLLNFKSVKGELLGFFRGIDNAAGFRELGCGVWNKNANEDSGWLANPHRKGIDDLGRIYGVQWTSWSDKRIVAIDDLNQYEEKGYKVIGHLASNYSEFDNHYLVEKKINQLEEALYKLLTNPSDRRIMIAGWNVGELDQMALPPCHVDHRFVALEETNTLHLVTTMRSWDVYLGGPFNIASSALFLSIMAKLSGFEPGTVTLQSTNTHLYENHLEQLEKQLQNEHYDPPTLRLSEKIRKIEVGEIKDVFTRIEPNDIWLDNYKSHEALPASMAVAK